MMSRGPYAAAGRQRLASLLVILGAVSGCLRLTGEEKATMEDLFDWGDTMHAQMALAAIIWDGARQASTVDPNESSDAVELHMTSTFGSCVRLLNTGVNPILAFDGCAGPYGLGSVQGELDLEFDLYSYGVNQPTVGTIRIVSRGRLLINGSDMSLSLHIESSSKGMHFGYEVDSIGTTAGGRAFDLARDPESVVDPRPECRYGPCGATQAAHYDADGCIGWSYNEHRAVLGQDLLSVGATYRRCPGKCPESSCSDGASECRLSAQLTDGNQVSIVFQDDQGRARGYATGGAGDLEFDCP